MPKQQFWLMKSEPDCFSIDDLIQAKKQTTCWDGVRNYQARNYMRSMNVGDLVFFYHSNAEPPAIAGICEVVKTAYPDATQFDPQDQHFDPKSKMEAPAWDMVDVKFVEKFKAPLSLDRLRAVAALEGMELLRRGSRLSVQPVTAAQWKTVVKLAKKLKCSAHFATLADVRTHPFSLRDLRILNHLHKGVFYGEPSFSFRNPRG